jgi:hypothetical protein
MWETHFDAELKRPDTLKAWRTLIGRDCDPHALKSALFYAARSLDAAQEVPGEWEAFSRAREASLTQLSELKKTLRELIALRTGRRQVASDLLFLHGIKKRGVIVFGDFPRMLEQFESILKVLKLPLTKRHVFKAWLIASGEALLHIYVKERTGALFSEESAVLLEAGAASYGIDRGPNYSEEAVRIRYRRFRAREGNDYGAMRQLVRRFMRDGGAFLENFANARLMGLSLEVGLYQFVMGGADPFDMFRRLNTSKSTPLAR